METILMALAVLLVGIGVAMYISKKEEGDTSSKGATPGPGKTVWPEPDIVVVEPPPTFRRMDRDTFVVDGLTGSGLEISIEVKEEGKHDLVIWYQAGVGYVDKMKWTLPGYEQAVEAFNNMYPYLK